MYEPVSMINSVSVVKLFKSDPVFQVEPGFCCLLVGFLTQLTCRAASMVPVGLIDDATAVPASSDQQSTKDFTTRICQGNFVCLLFDKVIQHLKKNNCGHQQQPPWISRTNPSVCVLKVFCLVSFPRVCCTVSRTSIWPIMALSLLISNCNRFVGRV